MHPGRSLTYRALLGGLDDWFARGVAVAGPGVVPCRRGCSACCHGPFDITPADARLVAEGLAALPSAEREDVAARAAAQLQRCAALLPAWGAPWDVEALADETFDALTEALAREPCPALAPDGACRIHAHRPATCRLTGLGLVTPEGDVLGNECPIRADFPAYAALPPVPFDLGAFECAAEQHDREAAARGFCTTTVAGAIAAASGRARAAPPPRHPPEPRD
jgi:Fe-S-cluster containining protein